MPLPTFSYILLTPALCLPMPGPLPPPTSWPPRASLHLLLRRPASCLLRAGMSPHTSSYLVDVVAAAVQRRKGGGREKAANPPIHNNSSTGPDSARRVR
eukprot:8484618-Pyramimonas_sp.AAC.1